MLLLPVVVEIEPLVVVCCKPVDVVRNIEGGDNRCVRFPPRKGDVDGVLILFFRNNAMILIFRFLGCMWLFVYVSCLFGFSIIVDCLHCKVPGSVLSACPCLMSLIQRCAKTYYF